MLSAMRYKNFIWPHNPRTFHIAWKRRVAVLDAPGGSFHVQELGKTCRILQGEGEFFGRDAYATFEALAATFQQDGPGMLVHPVWSSERVYFTRLELTQQPRQDYVAYAFEFTEAQPLAQTKGNPSSLVSGQRYTLAPGDTIWSVALRYGLDVEALLAKNPGISNPNALRAGQEVVLK